jgi:hypothetical protein
VRNHTDPSKAGTIDRKVAIKLGLTALLYGVILALALNRDFYSDSITSAFLSLALASALIVLVMLRRSWFDLIWVLTGSLFLAVLDLRVMEFHPVFMAGFSVRRNGCAGGTGHTHDLGRRRRSQTSPLWISAVDSFCSLGIHGEHVARHHRDAPSEDVRSLSLLV